MDDKAKKLKPFREVLEKEAFLGNAFAREYLAYIRDKEAAAAAARDRKKKNRKG